MKKQQGVVAIETALGLPAFLLMVFFWMEVSYMGFVASIVDYTASQASRLSRTHDYPDYQDAVDDIVQNGTDSLWKSFLDMDEFTMTVRYYDSVSDLEDRSVSTASKSPIAVFDASYPYRPLFTYLFSNADDANMTIRREVIAILEHERG